MPELAEDPAVSVATLPMPEPVAAASVSTSYAFLYALQQGGVKEGVALQCPARGYRGSHRCG